MIDFEQSYRFYAQQEPELHGAYHDSEYGFPKRDDNAQVLALSPPWASTPRP